MTIHQLSALLQLIIMMIGRLFQIQILVILIVSIAKVTSLNLLKNTPMIDIRGEPDVPGTLMSSSSFAGAVDEGAAASNPLSLFDLCFQRTILVIYHVFLRSWRLVPDFYPYRFDVFWGKFRTSSNIRESLFSYRFKIASRWDSLRATAPLVSFVHLISNDIARNFPT